MFFTPISAHVAHAIVMHGGVCIMRNFHVVWRTNIVDFPRIFADSPGNARTFPPRIVHCQLVLLDLNDYGWGCTGQMNFEQQILKRYHTDKRHIHTHTQSAHGSRFYVYDGTSSKV